MGYTYGTRLIDIWKKHTNSLITIDTANNCPLNSRVKIVGFVEGKPKRSISKKGSAYFKFELADENSKVDVMIFNDKMWDAIGKDGSKGPVEGEVVIVKGTVKEEVIFADEIYPQRKNSIYTKLSDLKDKKHNKDSDLTNDQNIL